MALWMVRSGKYGEREQFNLDKSIVSIGWEELPDLRGIAERANLAALMKTTYPDKGSGAISNWTGQVWTFARGIQRGDLVAMPLKSRPAIQFGSVVGDYGFDASFERGAEHFRSVQWLREIPRAAIDADLLYSFGAIMTVCKIERNDAESRIRQMMSSPQLQAISRETRTVEPAAALADPETVDLEELLSDAIRSHISRKFTGHGLAELVAALLQAQGYKTFLSPPGPDEGVDVLAGLGPHGFDGPKLAVQVKSGSIVVDTDTFRLFQTAMREHDAEYGLIVSWGGFGSQVRKKAAKQFFKIRMWGADDVIAALLEHYDKLPAAIQARVPLKRTWMLVPASDD